MIGPAHRGMARAAAAALTVLLCSGGQASAQDTLTVGQPVDRAITAGATNECTAHSTLATTTEKATYEVGCSSGFHSTSG